MKKNQRYNNKLNYQQYHLIPLILINYFLKKSTQTNIILVDDICKDFQYIIWFLRLKKVSMSNNSNNNNLIKKIININNKINNILLFNFLV